MQRRSLRRWLAVESEMDIVPTFEWLRNQGTPMAVIAGLGLAWLLISREYSLKIEKIELSPRKK